jgi:ankyrin repeat protein
VHPRQELPLHTIILSALQDPNTAYLRLEEALNAGADPNATDTRGYTPLHLAAEIGIDSMADTLLTRGSSPTVLTTTQCQTPLHLAARNSHDSVVKSLLRVGLGSWVDARDARGVTPLMEAFFIPIPFPLPPLDDPTGNANAHPQELDRSSQTDRRITILLALIAAGANPDGIPLHRAVEAVATTPKMSDVVLAMVRAGASLGITDGGGNTPLHVACCVGNLAIVRAMLQDSSLSPDTVRVLVGMVNAQGKTARQVAVASGYPELAHVLDGNTQSDHIAEDWPMNNGDVDGDIDGHFINSLDATIIGEDNEDLLRNENDNEGLTELHLAARHGQENKVAELIDTAPFLIAETDQDTGGTPLHEAAKSGHVEVVEMLLARGASVDSRNRYGETPLFLAAAWGHNTVARRLLECGADPCACNGEGRSPQDVVASRSDVAMWEMLVGLRLRRAAARGDVAGVRAALVEDASCVSLSDPETGDTALHLAARCGGRDTVIAIMDHVGLHVQGDGVSDMDRLLRIRNRAGDEPLHAAARAGQNGAIQALLLQAPVIADPDAPNGDQDGAIHVAAGEGWIETLRVLVQAGADVDRRGGRGGTALGDAACDGNAAVVRTLLELGADPDAKNSYDGNAPLHQVALWGRPGESGEVVAALLEFGADALALNDAGQTFKDIALANSHLSALSVIPSAPPPGSMMENSKKYVPWVQEKVSSIVAVDGARVFPSHPAQPSLKRSDSGRPVAPGVPLRAVRRETECPKSPFMVSLEDCPLYIEDGSSKNGNGEPIGGNETKGEVDGAELQGEGREVKQHEFVVVEDRLLIEPDRIRIDGTYSLGEGSYGKVYRGTFDGSKVAIKVLKASFEGEGKAVAQRAVEDFKRELMVMERMRHRNIQELRGYVMTDVGPGLVSEYYARGSLVDVLKRASRRGNSTRTTAERITWVRLIGFAVDVAAGMLHMHNQRPAPIVHRDLKASNCFVDEHWRVLVGDFGMTQIFGGFQDQKGSVSNVELQNPRWLAPELMGGVSAVNDGAAYTTATDVYSFGMLMYELLTWHAPWPTTTTWAIRNRVGQGLRPPLPTVDAVPAPDTPEFESSGHLQRFIGLMERCWAQNPDMRPAFREIHSALEKILDEVYAELRAPKKDTADEPSLIEL